MRPNFAAAVPGDFHTRLPLEPLSADESRTLAVRLLAQGAGPVGAEVVERLGSTAEGNPLFIEELVASLLERATGAAGELPTTVKGIIAARLDALPTEERAVVLDASVVGKQFWRGALERLAGDGAGLDEILDSLERRDLVRRQPVSTVEGDEEFVFKNMLIREVAYATLPKAARRERHAEVARFIEESAGERADENAAVLAHHWREAGETARAVVYLLRAAERAGRAWAKGEAVSLYGQALELMPESDPSRRKARLERAIALFDSTDYKTAIPELEALIPELEGRELFTGLFTRAMAAYWSADSENARLFGRQAVGLAEQLGDDEVSALALGLLSPVEAMEGDVPKAIEVGERALVRWRPGSYPGRLGVLRAWLGIERYWLGQYEDAVADGRTGFELGLANHNIEATLTGGSHHGLALAGLGRHEEALETFARVAALGRELELQPRFTARLTNMWAGTLRDLYDLEPARRLNEEAIELAGRAGFPPAGVSGRLDLLVTDLLEGEVGRAERAWPDLWERADAVKGFHQWLWRLRLMHAKAEIELAAGRAADAAETAVDALSRAEQYGRLKYVAASRLTLGSALLELGRSAEAADTFRIALAEADRLGHPPAIWGSAAKLGRALAAAGDDEAAETAFARARDAVSAFAAGLSPARRELFLGSSHVFGIGAPAR